MDTSWILDYIIKCVIHKIIECIIVLLILQAKSISEPFAYEEYRRQKIKDKIQEQRANRVKPKVSNLFSSIHQVMFYYRNYQISIEN